MPKLRIGIGDVLDARPLAWGFLTGQHADLFASETHALPLVGRLLAQGELDAGLLPLVDAARVGGLRVLPDLCVAFPGTARTLLLVSPSPLAEVRRVYLGRWSRTSAAAVRIVLGERRDEMPELLEEEAPVRGPGEAFRLRPGEAALLIGGAALRWAAGRHRGHHGTDLGAVWRELTGLPLVAGVWAFREGVALPDLPFYFKSSLRYGLSCLDAIAREAAAELGVPSDLLTRYLRENVTYVLQEDERQGLDEFLRRAVRAGALPPEAEIRFWEP